MALKRVWIPSPNYSSRGGAGVRLVIVHTAEGARTFRELGNFFASPSSGVSSHTGIDDTAGTIGEYVRRGDKAWTAASYNPVSVNVELCAFAAWAPAEWDRHPAMLENCGLWIREECHHYGIPITRLSAGAAQGAGRGVCGHADLGSGGGGHWDPGPNFPWDRVLAIARGDTPPPLKPPPESDVFAPFPVGYLLEDAAMPPDYVIHNTVPNSKAYNAKYGVWPSGLTRMLGAAEAGHLADVPIVRVTSGDETAAMERLWKYDLTLRGELAKR